MCYCTKSGVILLTPLSLFVILRLNNIKTKINMNKQKEGANLLVPVGIFLMIFASIIISVLVNRLLTHHNNGSKRKEKKEIKVVYKRNIEYENLNLMGATRKVYVISFTDRTYKNVNKDVFYRLRINDTIFIEKGSGYEKIILKK